MAAYADWVANFIAQNDVADYQLIGHSMGGKIALAHAVRRPLGLRRLVLLAPSPPTPEPISAADRAAAMLAFGQAAQAGKTFRTITQSLLPEPLHRLVTADNLRTTRASWDAWLQGGSREDISFLMPAVAVPCALLAGAQDRAITVATQRRETLPYLPAGTSLHVVPGAGYLLPLEAPAAVAALVVK